MGKKKEVDDRFKKFGTVSFASFSKVNDFIDRLEAGVVAGTRCKGCQASFFPPRAHCHNCSTGDMEWFEVTGAGKLVTYSNLQFAPAGFKDDLPYAIALVDYGEYKVFGRLSASIPEEEIRVGMALRTVANTLPNGQLNYVFEKA